MQFKEYKSADYWQQQREQNTTVISISKFAGVIIAGTAFYATLFIAAILEG